MFVPIHPRVRIGIALIGAFFISGLLIHYTNGETPSSAPLIQFKNIASDLSQSVGHSGSSLLTSIQSFKLPSFTNSTPQTSEISPIPEQGKPPPSEWITNPPPEPGIPTSTPTQLKLTTAMPTVRPRYPTTIPSHAPIPTTRPNPTTIPTNPPKPTKRPKPSPTPLAPPEYLRPGTGLEDIFKKAGELSCVPPALLKAFVAQEAPGVLNWSDQTALFYNAYDWWHRVKEVKQVCGGYGYYTHTGLVAEDSLFAGERCKEPFTAETANDTYSKLLGSCQMLLSYWEKDYKNPTKQKLKVDKVDRRVLIDCLIGYGIHFRKDTGYSGSCSNNWDMKYVAKAACVNAGGNCNQYNYCTLICNNYNKFAHKNYSCGGAAGLFVPGSYCQFK